jgi:hypothetical protein
VASAWSAGILLLAALLAGILINAHPGQDRRDKELADSLLAST